MADLAPKAAGDPFEIAASEWNTIAASARAFRDGELGATRGDPIQARRPFVAVLVKNTTGADLGRGDCMGIDDPIFGPTDNLDEFLNRFSFEGSEPTLSHRNRFAVCLDSHPDGEIRLCAIGGVFPARVNKLRADDPRCDVDPGQTVLKSGRGGTARILWAESGTGEKWAIIAPNAGQPPRQRGTLAAALDPDDVADVTIEQPDGAGGWEAAGWTEYDVGHGLPIDAAVPSGTVVWIDYHEDGTPWVTAADHCE